MVKKLKQLSSNVKTWTHNLFYSHLQGDCVIVDIEFLIW